MGGEGCKLSERVPQRHPGQQPPREVKIDLPMIPTAAETDTGKDTTKKSDHKFPKNLKIASLNVRSGMQYKEAELKNILETEQIDILALQEVELKPIDASSKYVPNILGYQTYFHSIFKSKIRTVTLVKDSIAKFCTLDSNKEKEVQSTWIGLQFPGKRHICLANYYREWSGSQDKQHKELEDFFSEVDDRSHHKTLILLGDYNLDQNKWSDKSYYC